jgi:thiamine phosphate phosphatase / amino-HMP aminohydrolase
MFRVSQSWRTANILRRGFGRPRMCTSKLGGSMNPKSENTPKKLHLILDWDGTIVEENSLPLLEKLNPNGPAYSQFLEDYIKDYQAHVADYPVAKAERKTLEQEYAYLESLVDIERRSIERIEAAGFFRGVKWDDVKPNIFDKVADEVVSSKQLTLRQGMEELIKVCTSNGKVEVLSVNWSVHFIQSALRTLTKGSGICVDNTPIYANEIDPSGTGLLSRLDADLKPIWFRNNLSAHRNARGIWTADSKAQVMEALRSKDHLAVYIGDSETDLKCLMEADIGIQVRDSQEQGINKLTGLTGTLNRLQIPQHPITSFKNWKSDLQRTDEHIIWYTCDLQEVVRALSE